MRVLVMEDDPELGPPIVDGLRMAGFAVDLAERLEEASTARATLCAEPWSTAPTGRASSGSSTPSPP
jgi:hypothetical protein